MITNSIDKTAQFSKSEEGDCVWEVAVKGVEDRAARVMLQCERFWWIASDLESGLFRVCPDTIEEILADPDRRTSDVERVLVSLALKATADSGLLLSSYRPPAYPHRLAVLHQIAQVEWENKCYANFS